MRVDIRREPSGNRDALDDASHAASSKPPTALVDQQGRGRLFQCQQQPLTPRQVSSKGRARRSAERNVAFLLPFSANQNRLRTQTDVVQVDAHQLRVPYTATIKQFEHQTVPFGK